MRVSKEDLHEIVYTVTRILIKRTPHFSKICNLEWRVRLRALKRNGLLRKFRFLINHLDLRTIVKCFNAGLLSTDCDILCILYDELVLRGVANEIYVKCIVNKYREGK